jgi:tRNA A22 N-methylase
MAEHGRENAQDKFIIEIGPRLAEKNNPLADKYFWKLYTDCQKLADKLSGAASPAAEEKALEVKKKLTRIKEVLAKNERKLC